MGTSSQSYIHRKKPKKRDAIRSETRRDHDSCIWLRVSAFVCAAERPPTQCTVFGCSLASVRRDASVEKRCAIECRSQPNTLKWCACMRHAVCGWVSGRCACAKEYSTLCRIISNSVSSYVHSVRQRNSPLVRVPLRTVHVHWQVVCLTCFRLNRSDFSSLHLSLMQYSIQSRGVEFSLLK